MAYAERDPWDMNREKTLEMSSKPLSAAIGRFKAAMPAKQLDWSVRPDLPVDAHEIEANRDRIRVVGQCPRAVAHAIGRLVSAAEGKQDVPVGRWVPPFPLRIAEGQFPFYPWQFCVGSLAGDWHDFPSMEFRWAMKETQMQMTRHSYTAIENAAIRFERLLGELVMQGYNAVTLGDVLHAIDYDGLPYGDAIPESTRQSLKIYNRLYQRLVPLVAGVWVGSLFLYG